MKNLKIGARLNFVSLAALAGLVLVLVLSVFRLDAVMRDGVADRTQKAVEIAHSTLAYYHGLERAGTMSRTEAQAAAISAVKAMRYGKDDYFWLNDMQPRMVMHPMKPEMDGTDIGKTTDADGNFMFVEMVGIVRADGEGSLNYNWPKPGADEAQPKISFVKGFEPWGWVVGSGVYVDDIQAAVLKAAMSQGAIVLLIIMAVGALNWRLSRSVSRPVAALAGRMRSLTAGDTQAPIPGVQRGDEIGDMAKGLEVFRDAAIAKAAADAEKAKSDADQDFVVETLSTRLGAVSKGDLTAEIDAEFPESYAVLKANFNTTVVSLRDLIGSLAQSTNAIRDGSHEIAQASDDLARRTEANAASLEETSAALSQMEGRLRTTAGAAVQTVEQTSEAKALVQAGRTTADQAVGAMGRVADGARGIDGVIEGLDKIAFQTRVLAMNAAVEAGRAGEAGRGFAVVADLVSALAMRSEEEAKRAREELTATQADIGVAVEAVREMDTALVSIMGGVEQVYELVTTMASDNKAQSETISEITVAVYTMDTATQQNAAMVEETSAASRNLAQEAVSLSERSAHFKTSESTRIAPHGARRVVGTAMVQRAAA